MEKLDNRTIQSLVSIIIPVYNHEEVLHQALRSIAGQTYKNIEVIVVDDGSARNVQFSMTNVQFPVRLLHQNHAGAPVARNRGLKEAKGEHVIFWDADVVAKPEMLEKMVRALEQNLGASYAYSNFYFGRKKMPARAFDGDELKKRNYIHSTSLIRRSAAILWDESLMRFQDWDLWLSMLEQGRRGVWIPECLFRVIPRKSGMSAWLPSFAYHAPWKWLPGVQERVHAYEEARKVILNKHF